LADLEIDVGEDQLLIGGVYDGGPVTAGEHIGGVLGAELPQNCRLGAQGHLQAINQLTAYNPSII
jgi:hypothetical protein